MATPAESRLSDLQSDSVPRWVSVADVLTVAGCLLAVIVEIGGGFRFWLGDARISVTSPIRLLVYSLLVGLVRHAVVRRPTLLSQATKAARSVCSAEEWSAVWPAFVVTRVMVLSVGLLAVYTIGFPAERPPYRISNNEITNLPVRWDAGWYLDIANRGYRWDRREPSTQQNVAFFPGLPAIIHVVGRLFGNSLHAYVLAGVLTSHVAFLWGLIYFYRLARVDLGSAERAAWAVRLLAAYPFSLFYGAMYTESLFLLGCAGAVVELRNGQTLRAAGWGLLVGLTRPNGFLLAVTLVALVGPSLIRTRGTLWTRHGLQTVSATIAPVAGMLAYSAYLAWLTGNAFQWSAQHAAWGRTFTGLSPFVDVAGMIAYQGVGRYIAMAPYDALNAVAVVAGVALLIPVWRAFGTAYFLFVCVNLLPPLFKGGVMAMGRLSATLFPLFLLIALKLDSRGALWFTVGFAALQAFFAALFYTWRPLV